VKYKEQMDGVQTLLESKRELAVADFVSAMPGVPMTSVYAKIRSLEQSGEISSIGKGLYTTVPKPRYEVIISPWMQEVNQFLIEHFEGMDFCLKESGSTLLLFVPKTNIPGVTSALQQSFKKVLTLEVVQGLSIELEGFIYVGRLVSESPFMEYDGVSVPTLEMNIVDQIASGNSFENEFQKIMEVYPVNYDRLRRYASRRGVSTKLESAILGLDKSRMEMFSKVQAYLKSIPVLQAWVFGSFARREETPRSDLDLLVKYDRTQKVSLFDISGYMLDLEAAIGREVDLVEYRSLKPFAVQSAERDKYLIYER
jgi:predicted nucleotidyltransferase